MATLEKMCTKCGGEQPLENFHRCPRTPDGHRTWCKSCMKAYHAARYVPKPRSRRATDEQIRENARKRGLRWYYKHRERLFAERAGTLFSEADRKRKRQYYEDNPDVFRRAGRRRNALKRGADGHIEHIDPLVVLEMDDGACGICGCDVDPLSFEIDHVVPLSRGGDHVYSNVQVAHRTCNRRKFNRLPEEVAA